MTNGEAKAGWGFPGASKKAHYFEGSMSLCRKWGFYFGPTEQGNDESPDNCTACMKALAKIKTKEASPNGEPLSSPQQAEGYPAEEKRSVRYAK